MIKYYYFSTIIKYLTALLEIMLGARVVLKFLGASAKAQIVNLLYKISDFFIAPFKFIFKNIVFGGGIIDLTALSTMIGYLILVLIILKFLKIILIRPVSDNKLKPKT